MKPVKDISIADIIAQVMPARVDVGPSSKVWLEEFTHWLSQDYDKLVDHPREPGLHCSEIPKACGRRLVLFGTFGDNRVKKTAGNSLTYDVGKAMHFWWQHRYLGPRGELWGDWACSGCPCPTCKRDPVKKKTCAACRATGCKVVTGFMPLNCSCGVDWRDAIHYLELGVRDEKLHYVGHTDGILVDKKTLVRRVFEFKTIATAEYLELRAPKTEHVIQAHAYMRGLGVMEARIVYVDKARQCEWTVRDGQFIAGDVHLKVYDVPFDPVVWGPLEARIMDHHRAVEFLQQIAAEGRQPSQAEVAAFGRVCENPRCETARMCPMKKQCFNLSVV